jgi:hypothetical protein
MLIVRNDYAAWVLTGSNCSTAVNTLIEVTTHLRSLIRDSRTKDGGLDGKKTASLNQTLESLCRSVFRMENGKREEAKDEALGHCAVNAMFLRLPSLFHRAVEETNDHWQDVCYWILGEFVDFPGLSREELQE